MLNTQTTIGRLLSLPIIAILIVACSPSTPNPTEAPVNTNAPAIGEGLCANPYYPVRQGATWTYNSTGGTSGDFSFTDTITSVRSDGFTVTTQFTDLTRTQEWACKPEGLVALQFGGGPAGSLNANGMKLVLDTQNASGVTFPKEIAPGSQWQYALDFHGTMDIAGEPAEGTGNLKANFTAIGLESVTVPAGTFNAMKVQMDNTMNIEATFQGLTVPVALSGTTTLWLVEGVGWVKAVTTGSFAETTFSETVELQSYNIP